MQFDVTNTLNDQLLENVRVEMEEAEGFSVVSYVPIPSLPYDKPGTTYTLVRMNDPNSVTGTFLNTLKFVVKDCDPNTGEPDDDVGYEDEYVVSTILIIGSKKSLLKFIVNTNIHNFYDIVYIVALHKSVKDVEYYNFRGAEF